VLRPGAPPAAAAARPPPAAPAAAAPAPNFNEELAQVRKMAEALKGKNHFEVLGLTEKTDASAVKVAYFKLAKVFHPDTVLPGAPPELAKLKGDIFSAVGEAYRTLSDEKSRAQYAEELKHGSDKVDVAQLMKAEELFQRACNQVKARKFVEAVKTLDEAIAINSAEGEFYAWRGFARFFVLPDKKQAQAEAMKDLAECLKRNERCAPAHYFQGQIAKLTGDNAGALRHFKRVVEIQPDHVDAQRELRMMGKR
jgi:curved DNA-binding protein CbpA